MTSVGIANSQKKNILNMFFVFVLLTLKIFHRYPLDNLATIPSIDIAANVKFLKLSNWFRSDS